MQIVIKVFNSDTEIERWYECQPGYWLVGSAVCAEIDLDSRLRIGDQCIPLADACGSILKCEPLDSKLGGVLGGVLGECKLAPWFIGVIFILVVAFLASIILVYVAHVAFCTM